MEILAGSEWPTGSGLALGQRAGAGRVKKFGRSRPTKALFRGFRGNSRNFHKELK
jgi:hypothetical protein